MADSQPTHRRVMSMRKVALFATLLLTSLIGSAATKVYVGPMNPNYPNSYYSAISFYDTGTQTFVDLIIAYTPTDNSVLTINDAIAFFRAAAYTEAGVKGYTITDADFIANWPITGIPAAPSYTNPTRSLNSAFQISSTRNTKVTYAVSIAATLSLSGGQLGTVVLEYADDSGFTTNVVTVQTSANGNTGTLALGLNTVQTGTALLSGDIPASKYVRLRTVNTTGTPTFTMGTAQEVLYN